MILNRINNPLINLSIGMNNTLATTCFYIKLSSVLDDFIKIAGLGLHDPRKLFEDLKQHKKKTIKRKKWDLEQSLEELSFSELPSEIGRRIQDIAKALEKDKFVVKPDSTILAIKEIRKDSETGKKLDIDTSHAAPDLKYLMIKLKVNGEPLELVLVRYENISKYRLYYKNSFYGDTSNWNATKELIEEAVKGKQTSHDVLSKIVKILKTKGTFLAHGLDKLFNKYITDLYWKFDIIKSPHLLLNFFLAGQENFEEEDLIKIEKWIRKNNVLDKTAEEIKDILKDEEGIDINLISFQPELFKDKFYKTPGFSIKVSIESAKESSKDYSGSVARIISEYKKALLTI